MQPATRYALIYPHSSHCIIFCQSWQLFSASEGNGWLRAEANKTLRQTTTYPIQMHYNLHVINWWAICVTKHLNSVSKIPHDVACEWKANPTVLSGNTQLQIVTWMRYKPRARCALLYGHVSEVQGSTCAKSGSEEVKITGWVTWTGDGHNLLIVRYKKKTGVWSCVLAQAVWRYWRCCCHSVSCCGYIQFCWGQSPVKC